MGRIAAMWRLYFLFVALVPTTALAGWHSATSDHFSVYGESDPGQLRIFVERVEKFDAVLRAITGHPAETTTSKLVIFVVRSVSTLQKLRGPKSENIYGWYSPNITGSYAVVPRLTDSGDFDLKSEAVLFHEYAHHFMLQYFPAGYPAWYVEGFAEYYSTTDFLKDGTVMVGMPAKFRFGSLAYGRQFPLTRMFSPSVGRMTGEETSSFYAYAWLLTHYLQFEKMRRGQLTRYLRAFGAGTPPLDAATGAFGDIVKLQKDLEAYKYSRYLSYSKVSGITLPKAAIDIVPLSESESALMPLTIRLMDTHNAAESARFVVDARHMASQFPNEPRALEAVAEGELDEDQLAAATKANEALLVAKPGDTRALLRRARIASSQMGKTHDFPGGWRAIRGLIAKANRAHPDDPFPLFLYFNSYENEGIPPPVLAVDGLFRALELAPQSAVVRLLLAKQFIERKDQEQARSVLAPLLNEPHDEAARIAARALLDGEHVTGKDNAVQTTPQAKGPAKISWRLLQPVRSARAR